jgi:hypothetical protein
LENIEVGLKGANTGTNFFQAKKGSFLNEVNSKNLSESQHNGLDNLKTKE